MATIPSPFLTSSPEKEHLERSSPSALLPWQGEPLSPSSWSISQGGLLLNPKPPASSRDDLQHLGGMKRKGQRPLLLVKIGTRASENGQRASPCLQTRKGMFAET